VKSSSASPSIFAVSSDDPILMSAFRETVRDGDRTLLKERKLGDPRMESGCKEFERSMAIGGGGTVTTDAADGRRAIYVPKPNPSDTRRRARGRVECYYVSDQRVSIGGRNRRCNEYCISVYAKEPGKHS